jgi:hypothetical protein
LALVIAAASAAAADAHWSTPAVAIPYGQIDGPVRAIGSYVTAPRVDRLPTASIALATALRAKVDRHLTIDDDLIAVGSEDVAWLDDHLADAVTPAHTRAAHDAPAMQHSVVSPVLLTEILLILGEIVGCDELSREEARPLQAAGLSSVAW